MVSTLSVVEPHSVGIGGDAFALIYLAKEKKLIGMNASGRAPYRADMKWFREKGINEIPERGILTVTGLGALHGWAQALEHYGTFKLRDVFEDSIYYAENGFPVTEVIAGEWKSVEKLLLSNESSSKTYLINEKVPCAGQIFKNKDLARTYKKLLMMGLKLFMKVKSAMQS